MHLPFGKRPDHSNRPIWRLVILILFQTSKWYSRSEKFLLFQCSPRWFINSLLWMEVVWMPIISWLDSCIKQQVHLQLAVSNSDWNFQKHVFAHLQLSIWNRNLYMGRHQMWSLLITSHSSLLWNNAIVLTNNQNLFSWKLRLHFVIFS